MPFYHAQEATEAMRQIMGTFYLKDETPIARATWRAHYNCKFIDDNDNIAFYKNMKTLKD